MRLGLNTSESGSPILSSECEKPVSSVNWGLHRMEFRLESGGTEALVRAKRAALFHLTVVLSGQFA